MPGDWGPMPENDAFGTHRNPTSGAARTVAGSRTAPPAGMEMLNVAADPFMANPLRNQNQRPRVKVSIISATGLPAGRSDVATFCTCPAKNKKTSLFRTKDCFENQMPVWDEQPGQMVMRWVPNDDLVFRIYDQEKGKFWGTNDKLVAECELFGKQYYPGGYEGKIPLMSTVGTPMQADLRVKVEVLGVSEKDQMAAKMSRICSIIAEGPRSIGDALVKAPAEIYKWFFELLGDPEPGYKKSYNLPMMLVPFIIMLIVTWLGWLLRHVNYMGCICVSVLMLLVAFGCIVMGLTTHRNSKIPWVGCASCIMLAVIAGMIAGGMGWNSSWRQWWWMQTGTSTGGSAGFPAAAASDAAYLNFAKNSSVDANRAAGFRDGDIYCAAPILDANVALGNIVRVEYWAIGINCCDDFGSFTCDASREMSGGAGVVMKGGGMPCFNCHADKFRKAALKSTGVYGMVSAPGALYLRYVENSKTIESEYLGKCIVAIFLSLLIGALIFLPLGFITNYKGFGKPGRFPLYNLFGNASAGKMAHEKEHAPIDWSQY